MKKILLLVLPILAFGFVSKAQLSYSLTSDTLYTNLPDDNQKYKAKFSITNSTSAPITFEWRMASVDKPDDWTAPGVCDWVNCYLFDDYSWHTATVDSGKTEELYIEMKRSTGVSAGCSAIKVHYREGGQSSYNIVNLLHTSYSAWSSCAAGLSTKNIEKEVANIYPNPTRNVVNLTIINKEVKSVQLSNIIGKQIQHLNIAGSKGDVHQMSMQALPKGIYILQFKNENGKVLGVKRITKQ